MEYTVIRSQRKTVGLQVKDGQVIVRAPFGVSDRQISRFVEEHRGWIEKHLAKMEEREEQYCAIKPLSSEEVLELARRASQQIPRRVQYYASMMGVTYGKITIRNQRTRWGSCSGKGNLNFNCLLMLAPPKVLDSVVVHELCHRKEMNHSERFYREVYRVMPDYDQWHGWLKTNGESLMRRLGG